MNRARVVVCLTCLAVVFGTAGCRTSGWYVLYDQDPRTKPVVVNVPEYIRILSVDDRQLRGFHFSRGSKDRVLLLQPGRRDLVARYVEAYEVGAENFETFNSAPSHITVTLESGQSYDLVYDDPWEGFADARPTRTNVNIRIVPLGHEILLPAHLKR